MKCNFMGLLVDDVETATAFYHKQLGWPVDENKSTPGIFTQFSLDGETMVGLMARHIGPKEQQIEPGLLVDNADATYAEWQAKGVEMVEEPNDRPFGRTFLFRTPDGHVWRVYSASKAA